LFRSPSKHAMSVLARNLCNLYPLFGDPLANENGCSMWFFTAAGLQCATGFLEERVKSQREAFKKKSGLCGAKLKNLKTVDQSSWESENGKSFSITDLCQTGATIKINKQASVPD